VRQELILFSRADLERSIPSMVDGLKPGQRKIMYCCFKRNIRKDVKARMPAPMPVHAQNTRHCGGMLIFFPATVTSFLSSFCS
jgi:hypothetical protein